jgi:hypothetical protein
MPTSFRILLRCFTIALLAAACGHEADTTSSRAKEILASTDNGVPQIKDNNVEAYVLAGCFRQNEVQADDWFKGHDFFVTGIIQSVQKDAEGRISILLDTKEPFCRVQCYFDNAKTAAALRPGMKAKFKGRCLGMQGNIKMEDCSLIETVAYQQ